MFVAFNVGAQISVAFLIGARGEQRRNAFIEMAIIFKFVTILLACNVPPVPRIAVLECPKDERFEDAINCGV